MKKMNLRIMAAALAVTLVATASALANPISGVSAIRITDNDGNWFYQEEVNIYNLAGTDVASLSFGSTTTLNFPGTSFGSTPTGVIDDIIGNCCGTGTHGNVAASAGQFIEINLPSPQVIDAVNFPIEIHNRQDGCCPDRVENIDIEFLDELNNPIAVLDANGDFTDVFSLNGPGSFDTTFGPGGGTISIVGTPEPASVAIWSLMALALGGYGYARVRRRK